MRMSCNGCRVLRKGCSENCSIRPCLQWIKSSESQANATVFLAKFYGRAGLMNLIDAGPKYLRPAIFKSLLYEACGRIVNPIHGSAGLLWSGNWPLCQTAVDAVLKGVPITPISSDSPGACIKSYDIRHVMHRDEDNQFTSAAAASKNREDVHRVKSSSRIRFKKSGLKPKAATNPNKAVAAAALVSLDDERVSPEWGMTNRSSTSPDSSTLSHGGSGGGGGDSIESMFSSQTGEAIDQGLEVFAAADQDETDIKPRVNDDSGGGVKDEKLELDLELKLGFEPVAIAACSLESRRDEVNGNRQVPGSSVELRLDFG